MAKLTEQDREDIQFEGLMRLVEGIILGVLDQVSISGKWYPRDIGFITLEKKRQTLEDLRVWFKNEQWDIWLNIYCEHHNYSARNIKRNFEKIRRNSVRYVNKKLKEKLNNKNIIETD